MRDSVYSYEKVIGRHSRSPVFSKDEVNQLANERILVTGAGGSIGSRISKLLTGITGAQIMLTDRDESALHSLSLQIYNRALFSDSTFELLDIRDMEGIEECFVRFKPTTVIHAAALKHLSVLQRQPREALLTNVYGTKNLLEASLANRVTNFVNISTDKAANPSSVLGNSKKIAELLTFACAKKNKVNNYTSCRFGNVFASRGSVIETFSSQIRRNEPITLTSLDVKRFFMHTDEAAYLTVKSLLLAAGDVHIFDMGESILLSTVIERMQEIAGTNIPVVVSGLREGEKLNEELHGTNETFLPTLFPGIVAANLGSSLQLATDLEKLVHEKADKILIKKLLFGLDS